MKSFFLILFVFSVIKAEAKKDIFSTEIVIGLSDIIVIGEIQNVNKGTYTFKINETLKGQIYKTITVEAFEDWTCDTRFDKVKKGQKLCLFLKKVFSHWEIINGSTGELPIIGNSITLGGYEEFIHIDYEFTPYSLSLLEFKNGIREFCKCYQLIGNYSRFGSCHFEQICSDKKLNKIKDMSNFSAWLNEKMNSYYFMVKNYDFELDRNLNIIWKFD